jgi:hypothetical protein
MSDTDYRFVRPLSEDGGGSYLVKFPDLPGCMSGRRDDRGSHRQMATTRAEVASSPLAERAKRKGVSLDTLAVALPAEGLGERAAYGD